MLRRPALLLAAILTCSGAAHSVTSGPPPAPREFRAVWVATVANIDWPSTPGLTADEQQAEAAAILDRVAALNLNAIVFQVRTAADALYKSDLEPWSAVLTGTQGKGPGYDPLEFWVEEAHRRGLQLHAWFNPFRAKPSGSRYELVESHVAKAHPEWVKEYGGYLWMDPGEKAAREQTLAVVADVVRRYDVDGVHIDDYFYPYPVADPDGDGTLDFPDDPSWNAYRATGGMLDRADWRRENINALVEQMYRTTHEVKPHVQFGVSPFGIPRPGRPEGVVGFDQFASLYADTERWLRNGWCDYWSPQLYWKIDAPGQPFRPLLNYWISQNTKGRHIWPGLSASRVGESERSYAPEEILGQIAILRETAGADGNVLFSMRPLLQNRRGFNDRLVEDLYRNAALVPASPWLDREPPSSPSVSLDLADDRAILTIRPPDGDATPFLWSVWARRGGLAVHDLPRDDHPDQPGFDRRRNGGERDRRLRGRSSRHREQARGCHDRDWGPEWSLALRSTTTGQLTTREQGRHRGSCRYRCRPEVRRERGTCRSGCPLDDPIEPFLPDSMCPRRSFGEDVPMDDRRSGRQRRVVEVLMMALLLLGIVGGLGLLGFDDERPHVDEVYWIGSAYYYDLAIARGELDHPDWRLLPAQENPPIGKYLIGAALVAGGIHVKTLDALGAFYITCWEWGEGDDRAKRQAVADRMTPGVERSVRMGVFRPVRPDELRIGRTLVIVLGFLSRWGLRRSAGPARDGRPACSPLWRSRLTRSSSWPIPVPWSTSSRCSSRSWPSVCSWRCSVRPSGASLGPGPQR